MEENILRGSQADCVEQYAKVNNKSGFYKKLIAFSLVELMISLITISCIVAAFAPVITKKLKKQDIAISIAQSSEIFAPCLHVEKENQTAEKRFKQGGNNGSPCQMCTQQNCIICNETCESGYLDSKACKCESCEKFDGQGNEHGACITCSKDACTLCKTTSSAHSRGYKIVDGKCVKCTGANLPSNGKDECAIPCSAPVGYVCVDNKPVSCASIYDPNCTSCDSTGCKSCGWGNILQNGKCHDCGWDCSACSAVGVCTQCHQSVLKPDNTCGGSCAEYIPDGNCQACASTYQNPRCSECREGWYLNSSTGKCVQCTPIANCAVQNRTDCTICEMCNEGYYLASNKKSCSACTSIANCIACEKAGECLACKNGYALSKDRKSCYIDNNSFCNGASFMQIGNLCVTRRNLGDTLLLKIPDTVTVVDTTDYCPGYTETPCCWQGTFTTKCHANNSGYSGCNRTLCNWYGANEACKNFNYAGKKWRLAHSDDNIKWSELTFGLGTDGLQICIANPDAHPTKFDRCENSSIPNSCRKDLANTNNGCAPYRYWLGGTVQSHGAFSYEWNYETTGVGYTNATAEVRGFRCVTELW